MQIFMQIKICLHAYSCNLLLKMNHKLCFKSKTIYNSQWKWKLNEEKLITMQYILDYIYISCTSRLYIPNIAKKISGQCLKWICNKWLTNEEYNELCNIYKISFTFHASSPFIPDIFRHKNVQHVNWIYVKCSTYHIRKIFFCFIYCGISLLFMSKQSHDKHFLCFVYMEYLLCSWTNNSTIITIGHLI